MNILDINGIILLVNVCKRNICKARLVIYNMEDN